MAKAAGNSYSLDLQQPRPPSTPPSTVRVPQTVRLEQRAGECWCGIRG